MSRRNVIGSFLAGDALVFPARPCYLYYYTRTIAKCNNKFAALLGVEVTAKIRPGSLHQPHRAFGAHRKGPLSRMDCMVSGGTGFIGRRIVARLREVGHTIGVWSRRPSPGAVIWDPLAGKPPLDSVSGADAVIHLAGEPVAQRWNDEVKRRIRDSRVVGTRHLVDAIARSPRKPRVLVSASAIGYYADRGDEVLTE